MLKIRVDYPSATEEKEIEGAMGAMTRTYLQIRAGVDKLTDCPAGEGSASNPAKSAGPND